MRRTWFFVLLGCFIGAPALVHLQISSICNAAEPAVDFNRDIRPLLSDRCFHCHGPDEADRQAGLRLDVADTDEGAYVAIEPGDLENSEVWSRITTPDPDLQMPPPDSHKEPLSSEERELMRAWIQSGAEYDAYWAFVPPKLPELVVKSDERPIDAIVEASLRESGMRFSVEADKRTLLRRLSFDLTGLPPTREQLGDFLSDDSNGAYERQVERLLDSPHFGEHLARYWLDLVRFADTNGIHHDHYRDHSPYRDWVIRSFNENLPYDDFVRYQIAGDLYEAPTTDQLVASGFHRLHLIIDRGTALPEESLHRNVLDRVTSVGTAFMGLTMQCAVCHDHKYDPISQKDFYSLTAFFNNVDANPETGGRSGTNFKRGLQEPFINLFAESQGDELAQLQTELAQAKELRDWIKGQAKQQSTKLKQASEKTAETEDDKASKSPLVSWLEQESKRLGTELSKVEKRVKTAQKAHDDLLTSIPAAMVMKERKEQRPAYLLNRGAYDDPGEQVSRNTPEFLPPLKFTGEFPTRMDFANWLVGDENPLTARVTVNRFWQQLFGVGLVKTAEDFGAQGEVPSHPELLDYLAVRFMESGWDVKALFKEMVMSRTYRQTSIADSRAFRTDPENRKLARGSRYRMDSEMIRDQVLAACGLLNDELYGKSVRPPQPDGLWKAVSMPSSYPREFKADDGDQIYRRSLYTFWKRGMPPPQMTILNAPSREECIARRERTNTPLQALLLLNETEYLKAAQKLAKKALSDEDDPAQRASVLFETVTSMLPSESQKTELAKLAEDLQAMYSEKPELAIELCSGIEDVLDDGVSPAELAAWTMVTSSIFNLDITKTRQ